MRPQAEDLSIHPPPFLLTFLWISKKNSPKVTFVLWHTILHGRIPKIFNFQESLLLTFFMIVFTWITVSNKQYHLADWAFNVYWKGGTGEDLLQLYIFSLCGCLWGILSSPQGSRPFFTYDTYMLTERTCACYNVYFKLLPILFFSVSHAY